MSVDPNKKSPRSFQCRDVLWDRFEQMALELECSVDYLVNDAMKQYARQRNYSVTGDPGPASVAAPNASTVGRSVPPNLSSTGNSRLPPVPTAFPGRSGASIPLPPPPRTGASARISPVSAPPPPRVPLQPQAPQRDVELRTQDGYRPNGGGSRMPPPVPQDFGPPQNGGYSAPDRRSERDMGGGGAQQVGRRPAPPVAGTQLSVYYAGDRVVVAKDRFVIGRGKQSSDLTLKDPNVSRQHAMVEFQNGAYFIVDMGSTNGVEFNGQRVARKQIAEGDIFRICDHEIRFSYR
jgi:neural Wiskott-Aldrich syndrome protein